MFKCKVAASTLPGRPAEAKQGPTYRARAGQRILHTELNKAHNDNGKGCF